MKKVFAISMFLAGAYAANAQLIQTLHDMNPTSSSVVLDQTVNSGEYAANFANGGGTGFGGTLGNGILSMDASSSSLHVGFTQGASLNDVVVVYLDTRAGGFTDATMDDQSDGGRKAVTNLGLAGNENFPTDFLADFAIVFASFGSLSFELTSGTLNYMNNFVAGGTNREVTISKADLGITSDNFGVNWFAAYVSETNWLSNESMPANADLNAGGNPGHSGIGTYNTYNRFEAVPEPASLTALGLGALALIRRRRAAK